MAEGGSTTPPPAPETVNLDEVMGAPGSDCLYEKVKVLGSGSFGQAWLVRRKKDAKLLVAKLLDLSQMSAKDQKYVEAEIQCLASCHHFAIVRYEEDFSADPKMLIVMEFADAGDLNMQIKARAAEGFRYFEEHEVGYTFVQLCMALDHVHRNKMLHRDIKGANVLLMSSGLVKLGDFGFSQQYEDTVSGNVGVTFCGTPYYLAPELWKRQKYSKKADIWSLGILLYEMMALKRPFTGANMKPLMESILKGQIPPLPSHFSQDLRDLCISMLEPDPNKRPSIALLFQKPYLQKLLNDFEKSAAASTLIDADTKALIKENIQEAREMKPDSGTTTGAVGNFDKTVSYEGPIRKESNRVWKERYFMLKDGDLVIAVKKGDANTKGISVTTLASVVPVPFHAAKAEGVFALNTLDNKTMWMQAPSKAECQVWIHKIQQAMGIA
uniref:non-specific serine/threonine protein kinase n=1 Tax=Neobodo designis TaxID=312471 RepID=A0A7S1QLY7_NEODS